MYLLFIREMKIREEINLRSNLISNSFLGSN